MYLLRLISFRKEKLKKEKEQLAVVDFASKKNQDIAVWVIWGSLSQSSCSLPGLYLANAAVPETPQWNVLTFLRPYGKGEQGWDKSFNLHAYPQGYSGFTVQKWCEAKLYLSVIRDNSRPLHGRISRDTLNQGEKRRERNKSDIAIENSLYHSSCDTGTRCNKDFLQLKCHFVDYWPPVFFELWKWF